MNFWKQFYNYRWALFSFVFFTFVLCLPLSTKLKIDPTNQAVFEKDRYYQENQFFQETFGSDDSIVVGVETSELLNAEQLLWVKTFSETMEEWSSVETVRSLTTIRTFQKKGLGGVVEPLIQNYLDQKESLQQFFIKLKKEPAIFKRMISADLKMTAITILIDSELDNFSRHKTIKDVRDWIKNNPIPDGKTYISGTAVEQDQFINRIQKDHRFFVPLTFLVVLGMVVLLHGDFRALFYPASVILVSLISTQSMMMVLGLQLNMITSLVSPVLLIVSVADAIHVQTFIRHIPHSTEAALGFKKIIKELWIPCLLTTITTAVGFGSLLLTSVPAVRQFGLSAALGTLLAFLWTFLLSPIFLKWQMEWANRFTARRWRTVSSFLILWSGRYQKRIISMGICALVLGIFASTYIQMDTDILSSFKKSDNFRIDTEIIQAKLGGVYPLEFIVIAPSAEAVRSRDALSKIELLKDKVGRFKEISSSWYLTDLLRAIHGKLTGKDEIPSGDKLNLYLEQIKSSNEKSHFFTEDFKLTRMTAFLTDSHTSGVVSLAERIQQLSQSVLPKGWRMIVTGQTYLLARMSQQLVKNELMSFLVAFVVISMMIMLFLRSIPIGFLGIFVNTIPLAILFGLMPAFHIPLNTATAMIGSVAVGLIVDNAIHVLYRYHKVKNGTRTKEVLKRIMMHCAQPLISSSLILSAGFSVTLLGSVQPTIHFGFLMVLILFLALAANLILLPAFILPMKGKK